MKKKILALCLVVVLAVTAVTGATLAYFTDTDAKTNTFTSGKVDITLNETFGDGNPETSEKLLPGSENAVQKEVSITLNAGSEDSYVWYTWKIPAVLDSTDGSTGTNNFVHVNSLGRTWDTYRGNSKYWAEGQTEALPLEQTWDHDPDIELSGIVGPQGFVGTETIDGVEYNVYVVLYHGKLKAGETTSVGMSKVYLDASVDTKTVDGKLVYVDKNGKEVSADLLNDFDIIVTAYAIQANIADADEDGDVDVYDAYILYNK